MIRAHYWDLNRAGIGQALIDLKESLSKFDPLTRKNAQAVYEHCMEHIKRCIRLGNYLLQKYCECEGNGKPVNWPRGPFQYKTGIAKNLYDSEFRKLLQMEFKIPAKRLPELEMELAGLSVDTMLALAFVMEEVEEPEVVVEAVSAENTVAAQDSAEVAE